MSVQALRPELAIEGLDIRVVREFSGPREVQRDVPLIKVTRDKFTAITPSEWFWFKGYDRIGITELAADPIQRGNDTLAFVAEPCIQYPNRSEALRNVIRNTNGMVLPDADMIEAIYGMKGLLNKVGNNVVQIAKRMS